MSSPGVYLFLGPETGEKNQVTTDLLQEFRATHGGGVDEFTFYGFEDSIDKLVETARSGSLFSSGTFIIFRGIEQVRLGEKGGVFDRYLKTPSPDCLIVLQSDEVSTSKYPTLKRLSELLPEKNKKIYWEMYESKRLGWITSYIRNRGGSMSPEAAELFLELVENNSQDMARECDKLLLLHGEGREITLEDIEHYIFHSKEENAYTIFGYLAEKDLVRSLEGLQKVFSGGEGQGIPLMAGLVRQFRTLGALKSRIPRGMPSIDLLKTMGVTFKRSQGVYQAAFQKYSAGEVARVVRLAGKYEFALREFRGAWHQRLLELFMYQTVVRGGRGELLGTDGPGSLEGSLEPDSLGFFGLSGVGGR
ncbi:MAG: DNA polymerase III subunit delta [Spirochaetales bacterium]|nr:DNA polymerase III subunit delta [Spirochaetales bacterium]